MAPITRHFQKKLLYVYYVMFFVLNIFTGYSLRTITRTFKALYGQFGVTLALPTQYMFQVLSPSSSPVLFILPSLLLGGLLFTKTISLQEMGWLLLGVTLLELWLFLAMLWGYCLPLMATYTGVN